MVKQIVSMLKSPNSNEPANSTKLMEKPEARRELSQVMVVSGGTISAKVEGSTDSARGMLHIFKDTRMHFEGFEFVQAVQWCFGTKCISIESI